MKAKFLKKLSPVLFFTGYAFFMLNNFLINTPFIQENRDLLLGVGSTFIAIEILLNFIAGKIPLTKRLLWFIPLALISFLSYQITKDHNILLFFIVALGTFTISMDKFIKCDLPVRTAVVATVIGLSLLGLVQGGEATRDGTIRYSLGFPHPNTLGLEIMVIALEFYYVFRKHRVLTFLTTLLATIFIFVVPNSRTTAVILAFLLIYITFNKTIKKLMRLKFLRLAITLSFALFTLLSLGMANLGHINSELATSVNQLTSTRITLYSQAFDDAGVSMLGNPYENQLPYTLDNAYLRLLISYGVLQYLIFLILSISTFRILYKNEQDDFIFILLILQIYGLMESSFVYIQRDGFLNLLSEPFKQPKGKLHE